METLLLSFNKIESLDGFPWSELASVSVVSVSDNKLRSLGKIYHAPRLASLSFENNNLAQVPCELGLCPNLRAIYMSGNPQKTVRGGVLVKGSSEVLAYLKNKFPPNAVLPPPSPSAASPSHTARGCNQSDDGWPSSASFALPTSKPAKPREAYVATGAGGSRATVTIGADVREEKKAVVLSHSSGTDEIRATLVRLTDQIAELEEELENVALSAPKRFALKKEVALLRSTRIREERKLKQV